MRADDAFSAVAEFAASQDGALNRRQADAFDYDVKRVRAGKRDGHLREPVAGVLVLAGTPPTFRQRLRVATLAAGGTVVSHRAAALLHGFDGFETAPVEVTVRRGRCPSLEGVIVHRATPFDPRDITSVDGMPITTIARTLCDLGAVVPQDDVERALDGVLRRGASLRWIEETLARVRRPGPSGTTALQRILDDPRRTGGVPASWFERLVRRALDAPDLPPILLQHTVRHDGVVVARFDAALPDWKIAVEAHSAEWHDRAGRTWRDLERDNRVKALGWDIIYVTWALAQKPDEVIDLIRRTRRARAGAG